MQKKERKPLLFWLQNHSGATLAELIAAMALNSLIMAAAMFFLLCCIRSHHRILPHMTAISLSERLLDQIDYEVANADPEGNMVISTEGNYPSVKFSGKDHQQVTISRTEDGKYLCIYYGALSGGEGGKSWMLAEDLYQGFELSDLSFALLEQKNPASQILQAELIITHRDTGFSYSSVRFIPCSFMVKSSCVP